MESHWENVYQTKAADNVSWYQERPERSLSMIAEAALAKDAPIIDIGAGASRLVDYLLAENYSQISLLDISQTALEVSKKRLGEKAAHLQWLVGDITSIELPKATYALWHDRAVFHFLTEEGQRRRYHEQLLASLAPQGHLIMATFALDGPNQCSGLNVMQYDAENLEAFLGDSFRLISYQSEKHITPWESEQRFIYCHFQRK